MWFNLVGEEGVETIRTNGDTKKTVSILLPQMIRDGYAEKRRCDNKAPKTLSGDTKASKTEPQNGKKRKQTVTIHSPSDNTTIMRQRADGISGRIGVN